MNIDDLIKEKEEWKKSFFALQNRYQNQIEELTNQIDKNKNSLRVIWKNILILIWIEKIKENEIQNLIIKNEENENEINFQKTEKDNLIINEIQNSKKIENFNLKIVEKDKEILQLKKEMKIFEKKKKNLEKENERINKILNNKLIEIENLMLDYNKFKKQYYNLEDKFKEHSKNAINNSFEVNLKISHLFYFLNLN